MGRAGADLDAPDQQQPRVLLDRALAITGVAAVLGCGVGVVAASRRAGHSLWWTLAVIPGLALFLSPGMLLAPCFLIGALAYARRGRILRALGWAAGIVVPTVASTLLFAREPDPGSETPDELITFVIGFALMAITLAWAGSHIWRPRTPQAPAQTNRVPRSTSRAAHPDLAERRRQVL